jgi:hypothetical protein
MSNFEMKDFKEAICQALMDNYTFCNSIAFSFKMSIIFCISKR